MVRIYSLPNCGKCDSAKQKLDMFNVLYEEKSYKEHVTYHEGWQNDGSLEVLTARSFYGDTAVPLIEEDGVVYDYPKYMSKLKKDVKELKSGNCGVCKVN